MVAREWQFDGIVGPTHHYAGLATGNLAAASNKGSVSSPRNAALQGLEKMRFVRGLGMPQAFLPPHYRPAISELRKLGFSGDIGTILDSAFRTAPELLSAVYSSAFMWAANAATVTLSVDNLNGRLHLTPANMASHFHRRIEADFQSRSLGSIFHNHKLFCIHKPLIVDGRYGDEAAANHMVVNKNNSTIGKNIFVFGKSQNTTLFPLKFQARQTREASEEIVRSHGLRMEDCLFFQQSPDVIDLGVFHNDVIAMNTNSRMIIHEQSFIMEHQNQLRELFAKNPDFWLREVRSDELSVEDAVATYFFNSQMLHLPSGKYALVAPAECSNHAAVQSLVGRLLDETILDEVHYLDVRESMRNGGGPACLRLRIVISPEQELALHQGVVFTQEADSKLYQWINQYYRDRLEFNDLRDPEFVKELDAAYIAFEGLVGMPGLYDGFRV